MQYIYRTILRLAAFRVLPVAWLLLRSGARPAEAPDRTQAAVSLPVPTAATRAFGSTERVACSDGRPTLSSAVVCVAATNPFLERRPVRRARGGGKRGAARPVGVSPSLVVGSASELSDSDEDDVSEALLLDGSVSEEEDPDEEDCESLESLARRATGVAIAGGSLKVGSAPSARGESSDDPSTDPGGSETRGEAWTKAAVLAGGGRFTALARLGPLGLETTALLRVAAESRRAFCTRAASTPASEA